MSAWYTELQRFIDGCVEEGREQPQSALEEFWSLICKAPPEYALLFENSITAGRLDQLCAADAYLSAAVEMVGPYCGILVTRAATGSSSAVVSISGEAKEGEFFGYDPTVALLAACAHAMLTLGSTPPRH
ncbi:hypothetical protein [Erythrobacter sp. SD-21]|uniref:hypothetical protein n=1 Tax=Erythrobacter sp. SD-21 TaxID=161528 RepID=UPI000153F927|nr:hypothetical protein [Erythrobacter sp. SD-21]EDL49948.1 hypothetical protein ED21_25793 [Erythrobacter sp. SD-21]